MLQISSSRLGRSADCPHCGAGSVLGFHWEHARTATDPKFRRDLSVFVSPVPLRCGMLHQCRACGSHWYLSGAPACLNYVSPDRLDLIRKWNEKPIRLNAAQLSVLGAIGSTPPDIYGNGSQYVETPCAVTTAHGESFDLAIVSFQKHAPYEAWRDCRLASEIKAIRPSRFTLSREVRIATSRADEIRMGFAPTVVELPDGEIFALNWTQNFFVSPNVDASQVAVSSRGFDWKSPPPVLGSPQGVVHFVADPP